MVGNTGGLEGLDELYENIVLDHYRNPRHAEELAAPDVEIEVNNPFCGDEIKLQLDANNGRISQVSVTGRGCAISQSSGSLLSDLVEDRSLDELRQITGLVRRMLSGDELSEDELDLLDDMVALSGVRRFPVRIKCALLSWSALEDALEQLEAKAGN